MRKSDYNRVKKSNASIQDRLRHKGIYCISDNWLSWAKKYLNRSQRRQNKQIIKHEMKEMEQ